MSEVEYFDSCDCTIYQPQLPVHGNTDRSLDVTSCRFYGDQSVDEYLWKRERKDTRLEIIAAHIWGKFSAH